jgi:hypothetical protein
MISPLGVAQGGRGCRLYRRKEKPDGYHRHALPISKPSQVSLRIDVFVESRERDDRFYYSYCSSTIS